MTGRDLIVYILQNHLEDSQISLDGGFMNLLNVHEAAAKYEVGEATIKAWFVLGTIDGLMVGNDLYVIPNKKTKNERE